MHTSTTIAFRNYLEQHTLKFTIRPVQGKPSKLSDLIQLFGKRMYSRCKNLVQTCAPPSLGGLWVNSSSCSSKTTRSLMLSHLPHFPTLVHGQAQQLSWTWRASLSGILCQSEDIGFVVIGKDMATWAFNIMMILKKELWSSRLRISRVGGTYSSTSLVSASTCTHNFFFFVP